MSAAAKAAVLHILKRLKADPRLAYIMAPGSEAFDLLMQAGAEFTRHERDAYEAIFVVGLQFQKVPAIQSAANACLSDAAPDLLSELLAAANYIDALGGDSRSYRAAIAKATTGSAS